MLNKGKSFNDIDDPLIIADLYSETIGGGTNAVTGLGNGKLTVGISPWAELVYFRWPTPSFYDHLRYVTVSRGLLFSFLHKDVRYGSDAPCLDWQKYGRPYEKYQGLGAKAGIYLKSKDLFWMDDPVWDSSRRYDPEWSQILLTELKSNENNRTHPISIKVRQWTMPDTDLLIQDFEISPHETKAFFYHATFAPWQKIESGFSSKDSKKAGFASLYCPDEEIIFWFSPERCDPKKLLNRINEKITPALLDKIYPEGGVFIALGSIQKIDQIQIGADNAGRKVNKKAPLNAKEDAIDGILEGNNYYIGSTDAGIRIDIEKSNYYANVVTSIAGSAKKAASIIAQARKSGIENLEQRAKAFWKPTANNIFIPENSSKIEKDVACRSILNLLMGRDKKSGAFVASPSRQPRYCYDWPRDGAFYDMALDLAGLSDLVDAHLEFYRRTQRKSIISFSPTWIVSFRFPFYFSKGHWFSNMNTDGSPGFFKVIPIEIDETSLLVWDIWRHAQYVAGSKKDLYKQTYQDALVLATDAILRFVDLKKGWTKKVMEDDNHIPKATLHGASAVLTALAGAVDLGKQWGINSDKIFRWQEAAIVLREGILKQIKDPKTLDAAGWRGIQWSLFPAPLFEDYSHPSSKEIIKKLAKDMEEKVSKQRGGFAYLGEQFFIFTLSTQKMPEYQDLKERVLKVLTVEAPVEDTNCYGEVVLWKKIKGQSKFIAQNRTSIPHLWSGVTVYLSIIAMYHPELIDPLRPSIPKI